MDNNLTAWIALATAADANGTLPPCPATIPGALPQGGSSVTIDTPDSKGFVALVGLPAANSFNGIRFAIQEIALSLPPSSQGREICLNAVQQANAKYVVGNAGFIGVATDSHQVPNPATGANDWVTSSPQVNIPDSCALPAQVPVTDDGKSFDCSTVAGATAYVLYQGAKPQRGPVQSAPPQPRVSSKKEAQELQAAREAKAAKGK